MSVRRCTKRRCRISSATQKQRINKLIPFVVLTLTLLFLARGLSYEKSLHYHMYRYYGKLLLHGIWNFFVFIRGMWLSYKLCIIVCKLVIGFDSFLQKYHVGAVLARSHKYAALWCRNIYRVRPNNTYERIWRGCWWKSKNKKKRKEKKIASNFLARRFVFEKIESENLSSVLEHTTNCRLCVIRKLFYMRIQVKKWGIK